MASPLIGLFVAYIDDVFQYHIYYPQRFVGTGDRGGTAYTYLGSSTECTGYVLYGNTCCTMYSILLTSVYTINL